jgi:hypothetical protein
VKQLKTLFFKANKAIKNNRASFEPSHNANNNIVRT